MEKEFNYDNVEETQDQDALKIIQEMQNSGKENFEANDEDIEESEDNDSVKQKETKLFANKYKTVDDLKKGIKNIGSTLPDYIIDGMNDTALEKHYLDLQKEFSSKDRKFSKDNKEHKKEEPKEESEGKEDKPKVNVDLFNKAEQYFVENGGLSDELYDELEKAGVPSSVVDRHIEMVQKETIAFTKEVYSLAGGEQEYNTIKNWAENGGIDSSELDYISSLQDKNKIIGALKSIKARYDLANNRNQRLNGETKTNSSGGSYNSQEEYLKDVSSNKYLTDELFRKQVDRKLANSKFK